MDHTLVRSFFDNDSYYPRSRPADTLYQNLKTGCLDDASLTHRHHVTLFLRHIDWTQRMKDALMKRTSEDFEDFEDAGDAEEAGKAGDVEATITRLAEDLSSGI